MQADQGLHPRRDMFAAISINAPDIELTDGQCATVLDHAAYRLKILSLRRADRNRPVRTADQATALAS